MKVKVCGTRDQANILELLQLPIDFIGFIFYPKSPRFVGNRIPENWINQHARDFKNVRKAGVFVNAEMEQILNAVHDYELDVVQLHGEESVEYCRELHQYWEITSMRSAKLAKAFQVDESFDFAQTAPYEKFCQFFVFDAKGPAQGGNGMHFNWEVLSNYLGFTPYLLSGGIGPEDAGRIRQLNFKQMMGVDINSRFELKPGIKDVARVKKFLEEVNG